MLVDFAPFPTVPHDVERLIIEFLAEACLFSISDGCLRSRDLVYLCRRYQAWIYPVLYRSIFIEDNENSGTRLCQLQESFMLAPHLALLVKHLTFPNMTTVYDRVLAIVPLCHNLVTLAYWASVGVALDGGEMPCDQKIDFSANPSLRRLSLVLSRAIDPSTPACLDTTNPFVLSRLTHLDLVGSNNQAWYPILHLFTSLTHLFLSVESFDPQIPEIRTLLPALPPALFVCILFQFCPFREISRDTEALANGDVDPRVVIGFATENDYPGLPFIRRTLVQLGERRRLLPDWAFLGDEPDFWEEAEAIVDARRRKVAGAATLASTTP